MTNGEKIYVVVLIWIVAAIFSGLYGAQAGADSGGPILNGVGCFLCCLCAPAWIPAGIAYMTGGGGGDLIGVLFIFRDKK